MVPPARPAAPAAPAASIAVAPQPATAPPAPARPASSDEASPTKIDLEALTKNFGRLVEEGGRAVAAYLKPREDGAQKVGYSDEINDAVKTLGQVAEYWLADPQRTLEMQTRLGRSWLDLWASAARRLAGEPTAPVAAPDPRDKRFNDPEWSSNQYFDFLKQAYLVTADWAKHLVDDANELDPGVRQKAEFYMRQLVNAASPSNFIFTNPELMRTTINENAENLVRGTQMLAEDIAAGGGELKIRQSDASKFEVGRNLAITPGKVIYQNELMQLIQYAPSTEKVLRRPLLIVPPWINKFYVLDLTPEKSFIRWCRDNGVTVFVISWVNPDAHLAEKGFAEYMRQGPLEALDVIGKITGETEVNAIGYCVGGTLLAITLAYMAATGDRRIASATLFTAQVDFTYGGDLKVFAATPEQVEAVERQMAGRGYLEGAKMATAFNLLRSNDLIWPYVVNNYLKGEAPFPFDLLVLEFRRDAHAGGQPLLLSAQLLSREQPHQGQDDDRRRRHRSRQRQGADLQSRHPRGPHRAGEIGVCRLVLLRRADALRALRLRPHRRRRQPADKEEVPVLDRRSAARRGRRCLDRDGDRASGLVVARLARLDQGARRHRGAGPPARRRRLPTDRGRAGELRQGAELDIAVIPGRASSANPESRPSGRRDLDSGFGAAATVS